MVGISDYSEVRIDRSSLLPRSADSITRSAVKDTLLGVSGGLAAAVGGAPFHSTPNDRAEHPGGASFAARRSSHSDVPPAGSQGEAAGFGGEDDGENVLGGP